MRALVLMGVAVLGLYGCESDSGGDEACNVEPPMACPSDGPTYADIEPILQERCVVCHDGDPDNALCPDSMCWALEDYTHVKDWKDSIRAAMISCSMPPPESNVTMTNTERMEILEWIRCGTPE